MRGIRLNCSFYKLLIVMAAAEIQQNAMEAGSFGQDIEFLRKHVKVVVLADRTGDSQVAVVPAYQGRVMTSTATGLRGRGYGWLNRSLISSGKHEPHINIYGGEDRFWLGPEGGQYSIFFAPGSPFDLEHWFTPPPIDTEPFEIESVTGDKVVCGKRFAVTNYANTRFEVEVRREVRLVNANDALADLGVSVPASVKSVGFESVNIVKNAGNADWRAETGLLSIWILGMFNASAKTTVVIPTRDGSETEYGPIVNDAYFGRVPPDRLVVRPGVLYFRADAKHRSKIGVGPRRAKPIFGSYDAAGNVLTLVRFTLPPNADRYVNSMWELQKNPYGGDVVNSYNDGPAKPGAPGFGNFYELETSSPALALAPGAEARHVHTTIHLHGGEKDLDPIARATLGVGLNEIQTAFSRSAAGR